MRKKMSATFLLMISILFLACGLSEAMAIRIKSPSQQPVTPLRDFYVTGTIDRENAPASFDITVKLFDSTGKLVRLVKSPGITAEGITGTEAISHDYPNHGFWFDSTVGSSDLLGKNPPPDLIFIPGDSSSFYKQEAKLAVTGDSFGALIFGGATKSFDLDAASLQGELAEGRYHILAAAISGKKLLARDDLWLSVAAVKDKMLTRFSPAAHKKAYSAFADENGYRVYLDYFPGYWPLNEKVTYEIPARWRPNDSLEYKEGRVHAIIYNIDNKRSTSQKGELGYIAALGDIDSERLHYYAYDLGEPILRAGSESYLGKLRELDKREKLVFLRAETRAPGSVVSENVVETYKTDMRIQKVDSEYLTLRSEEVLSLYGVTLPVKTSVTVGAKLKDDIMTYNIDNVIDTLRYEVFDGNEPVLTAEKRTGLDRWLEPRSESNKWPLYTSIYEFRHNFIFPKRFSGKTLVMKISAYTTKDKNLPAAVTELKIRLQKDL